MVFVVVKVIVRVVFYQDWALFFGFGDFGYYEFFIICFLCFYLISFGKFNRKFIDFGDLYIYSFCL